MKQIHAAVIFLELLDHAPDQPLPVSAASSQSQPTEYFRPESIVDFQQKGERIGVVKSLTFNETFTKQLQTKTQERLKKKESTSIVIFPNQKWVISFDTNVFNIINDFEEKTVRIGYEYCKYGKNKSYIEKIAIDFSEYSGFLNYISEVDEFKNSVDNLRKSMENIDKGIKKLSVRIEDGENYG